MRASAHRTRFAVALATVAAALTVIAPASAAPTGMVCSDGPELDLTARAGTMETPDGNSNVMWSYSPAGGHFQTPGPVLCVNSGATVTVHLHNELPEKTSIVFPGQTNVTATPAPSASNGVSKGLFTMEVDPGKDITYTFVASEPGTYVYESGTDPAKQVEMGLASALIVRPSGAPDEAYADTASDTPHSTRFGDEYLLILNDIDPELHSAVEHGEPYDITTLHDRYYTINGRSFPDTLQDNGVPWLENQPYGALVRVEPYTQTNHPRPALIRVVNVGLANHPFHPRGENLQLLAQDGRRIRDRNGDGVVTEHFGDTVPSGVTEDFLLSFRLPPNVQDQFGYSPANPLPAGVDLPPYRDLTFKDNNTWYSGSPYLGAVGTLPSTTTSQQPITSQNKCGAFFFPWHSHALNEFANYDAGFGGMATLLRVDPPNGCGTPGLVTRTKSPTAVTRTSPTPQQSVSGGVAGLAATGGTRAEITSNTNVLVPGSRPPRLETNRSTEWYATFTGVPATGVQNLKVYYTGYNRLTFPLNDSSWDGCTQIVRIWNWTAAPSGAWVTLNSQTVQRKQTGNPNYLQISDLLPSAPDSNYVGTGANAGQVRVGVACQKTQALPFVSSGDFMQISYDAP